MLRITSLIVALVLTISVFTWNHQTPQARANVAENSQVTASTLANGPLRAHPTNGRYFADGSGQIVYLTGSHTWTNLQDVGDSDPPPVFDYAGFLDFLVAKHHNFFRLWRWEQTRWGSWNGIDGLRYGPHPYPRTGPGTALDGKPKFDVNQFDQSYFDRLRQRVQQAGERGIYVSVMLFDGWSIEDKGGWGYNPWQAHPFHKDNNVNGINGDLNGDGQGLEIHSLTDPATLALSEAYVRKVIDTVNDLDNVLYEISNESGPQSIEWQYHLINFIKSYEATLPKQHPVGMTGLWPWPNGNREQANAALSASPADWISPAGDLHYRPLATGDKVILADTDHLCGICGDRQWVWMSFTQGENPLFMDVWSCAPWWYPNDCNRPEWPSLRDNLGFTRDFAQRINLAAMTPQPGLFSTLHGLANLASPNAELLAYLPNGGNIVVDLRDVVGTFKVEWFNPATGATTPAADTTGGAQRTLTAPFSGDAVIYLYQGTAGATPTPTNTPLASPTPTPTPIPPTFTPTPIPPTATPTRTPIPPTATVAATNTPTRTPTPTFTAVPSATNPPTSTPAGSTGATAGSLTGSLRKPTVSSINLTTLGTADWVSWGRKSLIGVDRKATGGNQLSTWAAVGVGPNTRSNAIDIKTAWTDGTPTANTTNSYQLICQTTGAGFRFTAPADPTLRTLKIYAGVWKARGKLVARLSDNSAPVYVNTAAVDTAGGRYERIYEYTLVYNAASAGQTLTVEWTLDTKYGNGDISLGAATLANGTLATRDQDLVIVTEPELDGDRRVNWNLSADPAGMKLSWTVYEANDIQGFHILRSNQADRATAVTITPELIGHSLPDGTPYTYVDPAATAETPYTYWLDITYSDGTLGGLSPLAQTEALDSYLYIPLLCGSTQCNAD